MSDEPTAINFAGLDLGADAATAASALTRTGLYVVPIPYRSKNPGRKDWQHLRLTEANLSGHFAGGPQNLGVILGEPSRRLVDGDLDCPEARVLAEAILPHTGAIFGRSGKPSSHRLYQSKGPCPKTMKLTDTDGKTVLVELRSTGGQTVFPPSTHDKTGEPIRFERQGTVAQVGGQDLARLIGRVGGGALLARHWPQGSRHDAALAAAGTLLQGGWSAEEVEVFLRAVAEAAHDEEADDRVRAVADTAARIAAGEAVTGWVKLCEIFGEQVCKLAAKYLRLDIKSARRAGFTGAGGYQAGPNGIVRRDDRGEEELTNFTAVIVGSTVEDDGAEQARFLDLRCELHGKTHQIRLPNAAFMSMSWPVEKLGPSAIVAAGIGARDRARAAIQHLSGSEIPLTTVYTHTGWRKGEDGAWVYLHARGAIGPLGPVGHTQTVLQGALALFELPAPPVGEDLVTAVQASLRLLALAPLRVAVPVYAAIWRAILGETDFSIFIVGPTGVFKSELAALLEQHFGLGLDARHLPGSWSSTDNALEDLLFRADGVILVIDDFKPSGNAHEDAKLNARIDRVLRGAGNGAGRLRLRPDATARPPRPPRGLPVVTGEDLPRGHSLRARLVALELEAGDIKPEDLAACQRNAERGLYAQVTAAFVQWLAPRLLELRARVRSRTVELRGQIGGTHKRTPSNIATLLAAMEVFVEFVHATTGDEAITRAESATDLAEWRKALVETADLQARAHDEADPVERYRELLSDALASDRAFLCNTKDGMPGEPGAWGWRVEPLEGVAEWRPRGDKIGWVDEEHVFLIPAAAYRAANGIAPQGDGVAISEGRLRRTLKSRGLLQLLDDRRKKLLTRLTVNGVRHSVLCLRADWLRKPAQAAQADQIPP